MVNKFLLNSEGYNNLVPQFNIQNLPFNIVFSDKRHINLSTKITPHLKCICGLCVSSEAGARKKMDTDLAGVTGTPL